MESSSPMRSAGLLAMLLGCALGAGCGGGPEPVSDPEDRVITEPADAPEPAEADLPQEEDPEQPRTITIRDKRPRPATDVSIRMTSFGEDVMKLRIGDLIDVALRNGGTTRGTVRSVRPRELSLSSRSSTIMTRLTPEEVEGVQLLFREEPRIAVTGDGPRDQRESWVPRWEDLEILGKDPTTLWSGRFAVNIPLIARRGFRIETCSYVKRSGMKAHFVADQGQTEVKTYDQIKLMGISHGAEQRGNQELCVGDLYLYLVRRGQTVRELYSLSKLHPSDFDPATLKRFLAQERTTMLVSNPGDTKYLKVSRVTARTAKIYSRHLERTPDRSELRKLRAKGDAGLAAAEKQVRSVYKALGLDREADLDKPLLVEVRVPSTAGGGIGLVTFEKEIGLD